jgi:hypothetical protein
MKSSQLKGLACNEKQSRKGLACNEKYPMKSVDSNEKPPTSVTHCQLTISLANSRYIT